MWSLPDIKKLNEEACQNAPKLIEYVRDGRDENGKEPHCSFCDKKATDVNLWYDVFSDDPKGIVATCEEHSDYIHEEYFYCDICGRLMVNNYTWELYYINTDGGRVCLNCAFDEYVKNLSNWWVMPDVSFEDLKSLPHLIPVEGKHWESRLKFVGNVEFDSMSGAKISGFSSTSVDDGVGDLRELMKKAIKEHGKCLLILDGTYQFAVSIGVYVERE